MSVESAYERLMRYCDYLKPYAAGADDEREHVRTDVIQLNEGLRDRLASSTRGEGGASQGGSDIKITTRIDHANPAHTQITIFQDGGNAGLLTVDSDCAYELIERLSGTRLAAAEARLEDQDMLRDDIVNLFKKYDVSVTQCGGKGVATMRDMISAIDDAWYLIDAAREE